jgi:hypothetical protein
LPDEAGRGMGRSRSGRADQHDGSRGKHTPDLKPCPWPCRRESALGHEAVLVQGLSHGAPQARSPAPTCCTVERPSEAATGSSRRTSTGFAGTRLAARSRSGPLASRPDRAKPGGTLLTPTPAEHPADPPSIPSKGMPPGEGTFPFPAAVPEPLSLPRRTSRSQWSLTRCLGSLPGRPGTYSSTGPAALPSVAPVQP